MEAAVAASCVCRKSFSWSVFAINSSFNPSSCFLPSAWRWLAVLWLELGHGELGSCVVGVGMWGWWTWVVGILFHPSPVFPSLITDKVGCLRAISGCRKLWKAADAWEKPDRQSEWFPPTSRWSERNEEADQRGAFILWKGGGIAKITK